MGEKNGGQRGTQEGAFRESPSVEGPLSHAKQSLSTAPSCRICQAPVASSRVARNPGAALPASQPALSLPFVVFVGLRHSLPAAQKTRKTPARPARARSGPAGQAARAPTRGFARRSRQHLSNTFVHVSSSTRPRPASSSAARACSLQLLPCSPATRTQSLDGIHNIVRKLQDTL